MKLWYLLSLSPKTVWRQDEELENNMDDCKTARVGACLSSSACNAVVLLTVPLATLHWRQSVHSFPFAKVWRCGIVFLPWECTTKRSHTHTHIAKIQPVENTRMMKNGTYRVRRWHYSFSPPVCILLQLNSSRPSFLATQLFDAIDGQYTCVCEWTLKVVGCSQMFSNVKSCENA